MPSLLGDRPDSRGQVYVLMALALVGLLAMVALIIDGGNAFAQQRAAQNGSDAAAEAGAVVIGKHISGTAQTDQAVLDAVTSIAAANGISVVSAVYTNVTGVPLGIAVGAGGAAPIPATAAGVQATGRRTFGTFVASVIGISSLEATTQATAVAGYKKEECDSAEGCALLPIAPPVYQITCDGSNRPVPELPVEPPSTIGHEWPEDPEVSIIPLCQTGAGNVGWIDWFPPDGGTSDTIASVIKPDNGPIQFAQWIQISQTGNTNSQELENAINRYKGQPVLLPIFEHTCGDDPTDKFDLLSCTTNFDNGQGTKMWYWLVGVDSLLLCGPGVDGCDDYNPPFVKGAYIAGNNTVCDTGNGATGCLVGKWVKGYESPGSVDANFPPGGGTSSNRALTVQLIR